MKRFEGRVSIVTGASQGIGERIALDLAAEGATVVLVDVQKDKLEAVASAIAAAGGSADVRAADVSDTAAAQAVVDAVAETGATSAKDIGKVMKAAMAKLVGQTVDGKVVNELVRKKLSGA